MTVRELILTLEECPGREDFKLKIPEVPKTEVKEVPEVPEVVAKVKAETEEPEAKLKAPVVAKVKAEEKADEPNALSEFETAKATLEQAKKDIFDKSSADAKKGAEAILKLMEDAAGR